MAKYTVECANCGKEIEVNLIGKHSTREWMLENKSFYCEECEDNFKKENNEKIKIEAQEKGLVQLVGSEKQINWANKIRKELFEKFEKFDNEDFEELQEDLEDFEDIEIKVVEIKEILNKTFETETKSKIYIDGRMNLRTLIMEAR